MVEHDVMPRYKNTPRVTKETVGIGVGGDWGVWDGGFPSIFLGAHV